MSTKIYYAYRVPIDKLNEFFDLTRDLIFERAADTVRKLMETVDQTKAQEKYDKYAEGWKQSGKPVPPYLMTGVRLGLVLDLCRERAKSPYREPLVDLDFGWNTWINKDGFAYLIPWGEMWMRAELKLPAWCEDYSYWDNTDPPEDIPYEEFKKRGKVWDPMIDDWDAYRMAHVVISFKQGEAASTEWRLRKLIHPGYDKD